MASVPNFNEPAPARDNDLPPPDEEYEDNGDTPFYSNIHLVRLNYFKARQESYCVKDVDSSGKF